MYEVRFRFPWSVQSDPESVAVIATTLTEALAVGNLLEVGMFPPLYSCGLAYIPEEEDELFLSASMVWAAGGGDCEDLAAWRLAELWMAGVEARAGCYYTPDEQSALGYTFHLVVVYPDGSVEDPSEILIQAAAMAA